MKQPTLAHFKHFSSLLTNDYQISTKEYVRIYKQIMQNKPIFPIFHPKTPISRKNKPNLTQFKANQTQFYHPKWCLPNLPEYLILLALTNNDLRSKTNE